MNIHRIAVMISVLSAACSGVSAPPVPEAGTGTMQVVSGSQVCKLTAPVLAGEFPNMSGDPALLQDGNIYRLFFTSPNLERMQGGIAEATSPDGSRWSLVDSGRDKEGKGLVLVGGEGQWDEQLETAYAVKGDAKYFLYYSGYPKIGWPTNPGQLGLAISTDGVHFSRPSTSPILSPTPDWYDANGLYSPVVVTQSGQFDMVYAGHCYASKTVTPGIYLLGATSADGRTWKKRASPVLSPNPALPWMANGVAEPALLNVNGTWYLFVTGGLGDDEKRVVGVARGASPFGPWEVRREPILTATDGLYDSRGNGVLAPTLALQGGTLRVGSSICAKTAPGRSCKIRG